MEWTGRTRWRVGELDAASRKLRAKMGAHAMHARNDPKEVTRKARGSSPQSLSYHEKQVDPDGVLDPAERKRRAEHARKAYMTGLALKSAQARRRAKRRAG